MASTGWPDDWEERKAGKGCPMCASLAEGKNDHTVPVAELPFASVGLERRSRLPGYCVVIWRNGHVTEASELDPFSAAGYWGDVAAVSRAIESVFHPVKVNLLTLGNWVPHLHTHVVPRYPDDPNPGGPLVWETIFADEATDMTVLNEQASQLGAALGQPDGVDAVSWMASPCPECGYEYQLDQAEAAGGAIVREVETLASIIESSDGVHDRPAPGVWSPLEYACHVRDVLLVQRERVLLARQVDCPSFSPMGRDGRVDQDGYADQNPADVARQLRDASLLFANALSRFDPEAWDRTVMYNFPVLFKRSLRWVAVHTLHEVTHHLHDVHRQVD